MSVRKGRKGKINRLDGVANMDNTHPNMEIGCERLHWTGRKIKSIVWANLDNPHLNMEIGCVPLSCTRRQRNETGSRTESEHHKHK